MRSVVVVLPASMCAMIPMLRVFSRGKVRGMFGVEFGGVGRGFGERWFLLRSGFAHKKGPDGPGTTASRRNRDRKLCRATIHWVEYGQPASRARHALMPERPAMIAEA